MALLASSLGSVLASASSEMLPACPDLITVKRAALTADAMGGEVRDWSTATTIASNVPCNIQNVGPREAESFLRRGITVSNKIFVPQGIAAKQGDRAQDPSDSSRYYIVTFISDMGGEHSAYKIYVNLVQ